MSTLNFAQIEQLWTNAGGDPGWAPLMAGIAMAESSGDTTVINNNPGTGDYSVGLWQINYFDGLATSRTAAYGTPQNLQASPQAQANAAVSLSNNGTNLSPWKTDRAWNAWASAGMPSKPSAATVQGWLAAAGVPTGGQPASNLPSGSGTGGGGGGASTQSTPGADLTTCVLQAPGFLFFSGPCFLTKGGVKAITGVAALLGGAAVFAFGMIMLAAWGADQSGAKQAVTSTARKIGIGTALLAGQPEVAGGLAATGGKGGGKGKAPRTVGLGPSARPQQPGQTRQAGRRESRDIERQFREAQREAGPIGPRGGSATSNRVAREQRRGQSVPGSGRPRTPEQRARARQRATEPF